MRRFVIKRFIVLAVLAATGHALTLKVGIESLEHSAGGHVEHSGSGDAAETNDEGAPHAITIEPSARDLEVLQRVKYPCFLPPSWLMVFISLPFTESSRVWNDAVTSWGLDKHLWGCRVAI